MRKIVRSLTATGLLWVVLVPLLLNLPIVTGYFTTNAMVRLSGLGTNVTPGFLPGAPLEDPSIGFVYEPNAKLAVSQLLGGHLPWWNSLEGTGVPLAGEMQSAAFSIFSPMLFLRNGQALINLVVELLGGIGLYLLLRRLHCSDFAATIGGIAFSLNGSFAWLGAEMFYPAAFLPLLLYRLECLRDVATPRLGHWLWIALLVALPVTCGFPETVYYDDLFIVAWVAVRCIGLERRARLIWTLNAAIGGALGVLLVSPLLIAFFDFLHVAFLGEHGGAFGDKILPHEAILQTFAPYVWGPISNFVNAGPLAGLQQLWPNVGGYLGLASTLVAALGVRGRRLRPLRVLALGWLVVFVAAGFGAQPFHAFVVSIPGASFTSYFRYSAPTWELCACVLIAFALDDMRRSARRPARAVAAVTCTIAVVALCALAYGEAGVFRELLAIPQYVSWFVFTCAASAAVIVVVASSAMLADGRTRASVLGALVVVEAAAFLFIPILANFRTGRIDERGLDFVRPVLGLQRVYTLGRLSPNTGSAYGIAQITYNDAPIPANLYDFVGRSLDQAIYPVLFTGNDAPGPGMPTRLDMLRRNLDNFASAGVAYVLTAPHAAAESSDVGLPSADSRPLDVVASNHVSVHTSPIATAGFVRAVAVLQGNYNQTATGELVVRICTRAGCAAGRRALAQSVDNQYFEVALRRPLFVGHEPIDIDIASTGDKADAIWSFGNGSSDAMRVTRAGRLVADRHVALRLALGSFSYQNPTLVSENVPLGLKPNEPIVSHLGMMPDGNIASVSMLVGNYVATADGRLRVSVCSAMRCAFGERDVASSTDNAMLDFPLSHPLRVSDGSVTLRVEFSGGRRPPALWLFPLGPYGAQSVLDARGTVIAGRSLQTAFVYTAGFGLASKYDDETMSVYPVPHVRSYFDAAGCTIVAHDRVFADASCSRPAKLVRLETFMPGWHANVNGATVPIVLENRLFQAVRLPAGRSRIEFAFEPPYVVVGYVLLGCALLILAFDAWNLRRRPAV